MNLKRFISLPWVDKKFILRKIFLMPLIRRSFGSIGKGSCIEKSLSIRGSKHIHIGDNCVIRSGSRIDCIEKFSGKYYNPNIIIGNNVVIEQNLHMNCANRIIINDNVSISSNVFIADVNHSHKEINIHPLTQELDVESVSIGEFTLIGTGSKILPGVSIGKNVIVGANSVVTKNVEDYCIVAGSPAKVIKRYDFDVRQWL